MNNTLLDTVAACSKDLMKFGFSVEEFATLVAHVYIPSDGERDIDIARNRFFAWRSNK